MEKEIVLRLPLCTNNLLCARLIAGAVANLMEIDIESADDVKVCVNEACLIIVNSGFSTAQLVFSMEEELIVEVSGEGSCQSPRAKGGDDNQEISIMLLKSLVDEVRFYEEGGLINKVKLTKRI